MNDITSRSKRQSAARTLVRLASAIDGCPTLEQVDEMLREVTKIDPQTQATRDIEDRMLDIRTSILAS